MFAGVAPVWENINKPPEPICLHQDCTVFVSESDPGKSYEIALAKGRQAYLVCIEGVIHPTVSPLQVSLDQAWVCVVHPGSCNCFATGENVTCPGG